MQSFPPSVPPGMPLLPPARIKVFGILHIVFAGIGFLGALWQTASLMFRGQFQNMLQQSRPRMVRNPAEEMQEAIQKITDPYSVASIVISVLLGLVMLVAGIALVNRRPTALQWSNGYAWSSIGCKLAAMVYALLVLLPAMHEGFDQLVAGAAGGSGASQTMMIMKYTMTATFVLVPLVSCVYPVLALAMLNKPAVRAALGLENPADEKL